MSFKKIESIKGISKTFILWFDPSIHEFKTTDVLKVKPNNRRGYGKVISLCNRER